jgi:hypothetical protein
MINLKTSNPAQHIGAILWLQGKLKGFNSSAIIGLMKIPIMELGLTENGKVSPNNSTYEQDNNPTGMSAVRVRKTTATSSRTLKDGNTSSVYPSVWAGIADLFLWMDYNGISDAVKNVKEPNEVITLFASKKWLGNNPMDSYKSISNERAEKFIKGGQQALAIRVVVFSLASIMLIGIFLKSKKTKYRKFRKALGPIGQTLLKPMPIIRRRAKRTKTRVRAIRRTYSKRK